MCSEYAVMQNLYAAASLIVFLILVESARKVCIWFQSKKEMR